MNYKCAVSSDKTLVVKISEIFLPEGISHYDKNGSKSIYHGPAGTASILF